MVRAIFFDFYSVWAPDKMYYYLANAQMSGPEIYKNLYDTVELYYHGQINLDALAEALRVKLGHPDISAQALAISENSISPEVTELIRELHGHFLKIGILANLGTQEYNLLKEFNDHNQVFEAIFCPLTIDQSKPLLSREIFYKAIEGIGEEASECLYISGNPYNLQFASLYGLSTLQFEGLAQLKDALNRLLT